MSSPFPRAVVLVSSLVLLTAGVEALSGDWPQFRGPGASGVRDGAPLPLEFDEPTWRTEIAGLSHASPVVANGRVFIATAIAEGDAASLKVGLYGDGDSADDLVKTQFRLLALDERTGEVLWDVLADEAVPPFGRHTKATQANSTPAVSGDAVVALFGSSGLFCFDAKSGGKRWHVDLGPLDCGPWNVTDLEWGFASSPIVVDGLVVVQADVKTKPFLAAFDLASGEERWRVARDDVNTWSTPSAVRLESGETQIVVNGCKHMGGYRLEDGAEVWRMAGAGGIPVPTPVVGDGVLYLTSNHQPLEAAHPLKPVYAVEITAQGDLGIPNPRGGEELGEHLAWMTTRRGNYMQTPLVYGGLLWLCSDDGILTCIDAASGEEYFRERVQGGREGFTASPVAGDGLIYLTSEQGKVVVLGAQPELEVVARADLGEVCMATPAIVDGGLVFRLRGAVARYD
ncbi:MAG: PQQ-binding-like beta-propeller repeat protein [Planctomycetota bacterium]